MEAKQLLGKYMSRPTVFNALCKVADRTETVNINRVTSLDATKKFGGLLRYLLRRAHLFVLDADMDVSPPLPEVIRCADPTFFMPFDVTAVEDPLGIVIVTDPATIPALTPFIGSPPRGSTEGLKAYALCAFEVGGGDIALTSSMIYQKGAPMANAVKISGRAEVIAKSDLIPVTNFFAFCRAGGEVLSLDISVMGEKSAEVMGEIYMHLMIGFRQIMYINSPPVLIMEGAPRKIPAQKNGRVNRPNQRPLYTIIGSKEAKRMFVRQTPTQQRDSPTVHMRRRHLRRYPDDKDRWPKMHGKIKEIGEVVVNGKVEEVREKKRVYRVRLDIMADSE